MQILYRYFCFLGLLWGFEDFRTGGLEDERDKIQDFDIDVRTGRRKKQETRSKILKVFTNSKITHS